LTEIGRYCGGFNEFVIDYSGVLARFHGIFAKMRVLPWAPPGAIIELSKGGAA
jgi:hypothetical protein